MQLEFWEEWQKFLAENWKWYVPVVATLLAPLISVGAGALWDYVKMKKWI